MFHVERNKAASRQLGLIKTESLEGEYPRFHVEHPTKVKINVWTANRELKAHGRQPIQVPRGTSQETRHNPL
jgi:hypothetical protein